MKCYKITCAALALCLLFGGCGQATTGGEDFAPDGGALDTSPVGKEAAQYVQTAREETFRLTDKNGSDSNAVYRIPALTATTTDARIINAEITSKYNPLFDAARQAADQNTDPEPDAVDYSAYVNDDVVTVVITAEGQSHSMRYDVFNYNKTTGKRMNNVDLLNYLQRSYDDTFKALSKALEADYTAKFKEENFPDDYYYQLDLTVGDAAVRQSRLFLNQNAELYAVCTEYAGVGSGTFEVLIRC